MPKTERIVINTSPLIALVAASGDLNILHFLYREVLVPFERKLPHTNVLFCC
jgi:hypothetical protein